ncbi:MAG: SDR family oxidoreductase [Terriglobia bacterium]
MKGRICLITGANSGIGKATALGLAKMGATVVMVCRNQGRGAAALQEIKAQSGNEAVELMLADLSCQAAVRQLAQDFKDRYQQLHVLVNNAGLQLWERSLTVDSIETTFAVNHLAAFLLTNLLLDVLKAGVPSRIVNVSSVVHRWASIDFDNLQGEAGYNSNRAYYQSKLANVYFTYELARRLKGTGVTVNCLEPGMVRTNFARDFRGFFRLMAILYRPFMKSPEKGAEPVLYLACSPEVEGVSGKYFAKKRELRSSKQSYDTAIARRLLEVSEELTASGPRSQGDGVGDYATGD